MNTIIVGYTGFVGSNLCNSTHFDCYYNSKNISISFGTEPDLLIYAGVPAEMFLANKEPEKDLEIIYKAIDNIRRINAKRVVLISSIAVYNRTYNVDENSIIDKSSASAYGHNRRCLEEWVEQNCPNSLIVRLPGLFGENIKKNFIFDMINIIPSMLIESKYNELANTSTLIKKSYQLQDNGFAKCITNSNKEKLELKAFFQKIHFTALQFTDSRGIYQYFYLSQLWDIIKKALSFNIPLLNIAVEPITISELYSYVYDGKEFVNELNRPIPHFDFRTKYAKLFNGDNGYIIDKQTCLEQIKQFVIKESAK